mgnify:CR=1 FL=1
MVGLLEDVSQDEEIKETEGVACATEWDGREVVAVPEETGLHAPAKRETPDEIFCRLPGRTLDTVKPSSLTPALLPSRPSEHTVETWRLGPAILFSMGKSFLPHQKWRLGFFTLIFGRGFARCLFCGSGLFALR